MFFAPPEVKSISRYSDFGSHLGPRAFGVTLVIAVILHAVFIGIYAMMPNTPVVKIPVRVLNINLGADINETPPPSEQPDVTEETPPATPVLPVIKELPVTEGAKKAPQIELDKALGAVAAKSAEPPREAKEAPSPAHAAAKKLREAAAPVAKKEAAKEPAPSTPKSYVRESPLDLTRPKGETAAKVKTPEQKEEIIRDYEQDVSRWIAQRKVYPEEAKRRRAEGEAIIRLRLNRQGHIIYYVVDKSTGDPFLDHAAMAMVRAADPVPAVPANYPLDGDVLEFLVPVIFKLEK